MVDEQIIELFEEFKTLTGKYTDFDIEDIEFEFNSIKIIAEKFQSGGTPEKNNKHYWGNNSSIVDNKNFFGWRNIEKEIFNTGYINQYSDIITKSGYDNSSTWLVPKNSILIAIASASKGLIAINNMALCTNQNIISLVLKENFNTNYIYYCLKEVYSKLDDKKEFGNLTKRSEEKREIPIPKQINKTYTSYKIQEILVEFIEYYSNRNNKGIKIINEEIFPRIEKIEKLVLPQFFDKEKTMCAIFNSYAKKNNYDVNLEDVEFEKENFLDIVILKNGSEFPKNYVKRPEIAGNIPLISAGIKKDVMGYIKSLKGNNKDNIEEHFVYNNTKNKWNLVTHYIGKDFYTINADGVGGSIFKRKKEDYPNGFYTTNVCKVLQFNVKDVFEEYFFFAYRNGKSEIKFDFSTKANNENLSRIKINIPKPTENYTSFELQKIFADFIANYFKRVEGMRNLSQYLIEKYNYHTETVISRTLKA